MKRTKPICSQCGLDMFVSEMGVECVMMFQSQPQPYRIISGDEFACPNCETKIVSQFADKGKDREHYHDDFIETLTRYLKSDVIRPRIRVVWEKLIDSHNNNSNSLEYLDNWVREQESRVVE